MSEQKTQMTDTETHANTDPSFAQCASWWLDGSATADPADLLRGLLGEHGGLVARITELEQQLADWTGPVAAANKEPQT